MKVPFVDLVAWAKPSREEYLAELAKLIDTGAYVGGPQVGSFEAAFATSSLPEKPDVERVNQFLIRARRSRV